MKPKKSNIIFISGGRKGGRTKLMLDHISDNEPTGKMCAISVPNPEYAKAFIRHWSPVYFDLGFHLRTLSHELATKVTYVVEVTKL